MALQLVLSDWQDVDNKTEDVENEKLHLPDEIVEEVEDDILKQQREKDVEEDDERLDRGLDVL